MPFIVDGVINILLLMMYLAGPTPVAGRNGTTAAFLQQQQNSGSVVAHLRGR